jgi:hypothetical protein
MKKIVIFLVAFIFMGCGGSSTQTTINEDNSSTESEPTDTPNDDTTTTDEIVDKLGKAQLGVMANATVKLYIVEGTEQRLLATKITSRGDSIETIGNFNLHLELLEDNKLYLYEVSGGEDNDVDDNGEIDETPTQNLGSFQLIARGKRLKKAQRVNITIVSTIVYKLVKPYLSSGDIASKLLIFSREVIQKDIDGDGNIGMGDVLSYNPIYNRPELSANYRDKIFEMVDNILNGRELNFEQIVNATSSGVSYPTNEAGLQDALDHGHYNYVIHQLKHNRDAYSDMNNDKVNMNIAGAYVGISGYTVFDITGAIASSNDNNHSLNGFVRDITEDNNALNTLKSLEEADRYYSEVVNGLNCSDTTGLTDEQKASCFNLGLVRLTALCNSVKLLFGGEEELVRAWADGVDINSSDDLNGNTVVDGTDASACAIVYANDPTDNCRDGSMFTYRGKVSFNRFGTEHNTTLLNIDVGSTTHGFHNFYKLTTNRANNNSVVLTNGVCDRNLNMTTNSIDGRDYFPCPTFNNDGTIMTIADSLTLSTNVQELFPDGSDTENTANGYIQNITGAEDGVIDQNNLSDYLQRH